MKTESNRKNAQKSTGPKSAAGKAIVSQNARTHGLLSRNLIIEGESLEEFSELLRLLADEFQPIGLVEHALVERVGIALWRQRRLVRAESAEVSLNQQRFGDEQKREVGQVLNLGYQVYEENRDTHPIFPLTFACLLVRLQPVRIGRGELHADHIKRSSHHSSECP